MKKQAIAVLASVALFALPALGTAAEAPAQYQSSCFACHGTGAAGAPKTGDTAAWEPKVSLGLEAMIASVRNGKGAMPPGGLCADCSDDDLKKLIEFMAGHSF